MCLLHKANDNCECILLMFNETYIICFSFISIFLLFKDTAARSQKWTWLSSTRRTTREGTTLVTTTWSETNPGGRRFSGEASGSTWPSGRRRARSSTRGSTFSASSSLLVKMTYDNLMNYRQVVKLYWSSGPKNGTFLAKYRGDPLRTSS